MLGLGHIDGATTYNNLEGAYDALDDLQAAKSAVLYNGLSVSNNLV